MKNEQEVIDNQEELKKVEPLFTGDNYLIYNSKMEAILDQMEPNSVDAVVTDPPYEINFMNKGWDNTGIVFQKETWEKIYQ